MNNTENFKRVFFEIRLKLDKNYKKKNFLDIH